MVINYAESPILAIATAANVAVPLCMDAEYPAGQVVCKDNNGLGTEYKSGEVTACTATLSHKIGVASLHVYTNSEKTTELQNTEYSVSNGVISITGPAMWLPSVYCEYNYTASATATLAHTENVASLHVYTDNTKATELAVTTDYTVANGVITLLGDNVGLASVYCEYNYGEAPGTPATETATVTAVSAAAAENIETEQTFDDPSGVPFGILLNDCLAPADEPRETAVLISGFVYRSAIKGLDPNVEQTLNKISFLDNEIATEG